MEPRVIASTNARRVAGAPARTSANGSRPRSTRPATTTGSRTTPAAIARRSSSPRTRIAPSGRRSPAGSSAQARRVRTSLLHAGADSARPRKRQDRTDTRDETAPSTWVAARVRPSSPAHARASSRGTKRAVALTNHAPIGRSWIGRSRARSAAAGRSSRHRTNQGSPSTVTQGSTATLSPVEGVTTSMSSCSTARKNPSARPSIGVPAGVSSPSCAAPTSRSASQTRLACSARKARAAGRSSPKSEGATGSTSPRRIVRISSCATVSSRARSSLSGAKSTWWVAPSHSTVRLGLGGGWMGTARGSASSVR